MSEQDESQTVPSLDDVYKQYNVEEVAQTFNASPAPKPPAQPVNVPDPALDLDGFKRWAGQVQSSDEELKTTLFSVNERLQKWEQERIRTQEEADLKAAVTKLKAKVDVEEDFLEVALAHKARKDPKFLRLWETRSQNPKAWDAALAAVSNEFAGKFSIRQDPQLAENQRAIKTSQQQMATTPKQSPDEKWSNLGPKEFEQEWERLSRSSY